MSRLIRNYQAGSQIVLSDQLRQYMADGGQPQISDAELGRRLRQQAEEMAMEAAQALAQAQAKARALLQDAQEDVLALQAEAQARGYAEGYGQGLSEGRQAGEKTLIGGIEEVQTLLYAIQSERTHLLLQAEEEVATLAVAIAEKVVGRLARQQREIIGQTVNRALNEVTISGPFALRVHPDDAAYLERAWRGADAVGEEYSWKLLADPAIEPGGCLLTCGPASVDARLSTQLRSIVNGLALTNYRLESENDESEGRQAPIDSQRDVATK